MCDFVFIGVVMGNYDGEIVIDIKIKDVEKRVGFLIWIKVKGKVREIDVWKID